MNQTQSRPPLVRRAGEPDADELARMLCPTGTTSGATHFPFVVSAANVRGWRVVSPVA